MTRKEVRRERARKMAELDSTISHLLQEIQAARLDFNELQSLFRHLLTLDHLKAHIETLVMNPFLAVLNYCNLGPKKKNK